MWYFRENKFIDSQPYLAQRVLPVELCCVPYIRLRTVYV
jgi:hypothetical protein